MYSFIYLNIVIFLTGTVFKKLDLDMSHRPKSKYSPVICKYSWLTRKTGRHPHSSLELLRKESPIEFFYKDKKCRTSETMVLMP